MTKERGPEYQYGFKEITSDNWLEPDPIMVTAFSGLTGEERVRELMSVELHESVPFEVRRLFAVARGVACYGYLFYPIYTLASEQMTRVAETAVRYKYRIEGGIKHKKTSYKQKLAYLQEQGMIPERDAIWWSAIKDMRDDASHPQDHVPAMPQDAIHKTYTLGRKLNDMFNS